IRVLEAPEIFVGLIHAGNTAPKRTTDPAWRLQPLDCIAEIAGNWAQAPARRGRRFLDPLSDAVAVAASPPKVCIGVYVRFDPARLTETLSYLRANTALPVDIMLLGDGPDPATRAMMMHLAGYRQSTTDTPCGAAASFNRLLRDSSSDILVF